MNPKVSILIPVYNVSNFIEKCAESLFNQTFKEIEYVFVNDGTTDDSIEKLLKVIELFPERKESIQIIQHSVNQGTASTKNEALNAASGEYISFVDSDDYIEPDMIEVMVRKAIETDADIVVSDMIMEYPDRTEIVEDYLSDIENEHFKDIILNDYSHTFLCNKLVRRELYLRPDSRAPQGLNYYEDRHIMSRLYYFAKKIVKLNRAFYHYVHYNPLAITKNKNRMHFENVLTFWNLFDDFLKEHNEYEKYKSILALPKTQSKVRLMIDTNSASLRREYADIFQEEELKCINSFNKGEKIMLWLVRYEHFDLAQWFHDLLVWKNKIKR